MDKQPGTDEVAAVHGWRENRIAELERERDDLRAALVHMRKSVAAGDHDILQVGTKWVRERIDKILEAASER